MLLSQNNAFQIVSYFSFILRQISLTLTKFIEKRTYIYNIKQDSLEHHEMYFDSVFIWNCICEYKLSQSYKKIDLWQK